MRFMLCSVQDLKFFQKLEKFTSYTVKVAQANPLYYLLRKNTIFHTMDLTGYRRNFLWNAELQFGSFVIYHIKPVWRPAFLKIQFPIHQVIKAIDTRKYRKFLIFYFCTSFVDFLKLKGGGCWAGGVQEINLQNSTSALSFSSRESVRNSAWSGGLRHICPTLIGSPGILFINFISLWFYASAGLRCGRVSVTGSSVILAT